MTYPPQGPYGEQQGGYGPPSGGYGPPSGGFGQQQPPSGGFGQQQPPSGGFGQQQPPSGGFGQQQPPSGGFGQQQPPSGGFPQQPGYQPQGGYQQQQGGYDPYGQQQGFGQYGQQGGGDPFGQPPKKNNKVIIAAIAGVVGVLLVAFLITGLWAPGFLVSDDEEAAPPPASTPPSVSTPAPAPGGQSTAPAPGGETPPPITPDGQSTPTTTPDSSGDDSGGSITAASAAKVMDAYLAAISKGDASGAKKYACQFHDTKKDVKDKLKVKRVSTPKPLGKSGTSFDADISGTKKGKSIDSSFSSISTMKDYEDGKPCVLLVLAL